MRSFDSNTIAAIAKPSTVLRTFLYIRGKDSEGDPATFGFWNDSESVNVSVTSAIDGASDSRTYLGDGAVLSVPPVPVTIGLEARTIEFGLSMLHSSVESMLYDNNIRHAVTEVHRGYFDISTRQLVAAPFPSFLGKVNGASVRSDGPDGGRVMTLRLVSNARELTLKNPGLKSDETQKLRSGDRFRRYTGAAGTYKTWWGEAQGGE